MSDVLNYSRFFDIYHHRTWRDIPPKSVQLLPEFFLRNKENIPPRPSRTWVQTNFCKKVYPPVLEPAVEAAAKAGQAVAVV